LIKKNQYIEIVQRRCCGGEPTADLISRYHPKIIEKEIDQVYESLLQSLFVQNIKGGNFAVLDAYAHPYPNANNPSPVLIKKDIYRNEFYCDLPAPVIALNSPGNGTGNYGIRIISPTKDQSVQFIPIDNNADVVFSQLEVSIVCTIPSYYVEGSRVFFNFRGQSYEEGDALLFKIVPTFSSLSDNDYVTMPQFMTKSGMLEVTDMVVERLTGMKPEKVTNDNNSTV
jgi:hypothetical protein